MFQVFVAFFVFVVFQSLSIGGQQPEVVLDDVIQVGFDAIDAGESLKDVVYAETVEEAIDALASSAEGVIDMGKDILVLESDLSGTSSTSTSGKEIVENADETNDQITVVHEEDVPGDVLIAIDPPDSLITSDTSNAEPILYDAIILEEPLPIFDVVLNPDSAGVSDYEATKTENLYADSNPDTLKIIDVTLENANIFITNNQSIGYVIYDESTNTDSTNVTMNTDIDFPKPLTKAKKYECDHEGQIIPNSQLSIYFYCKKINSDLKPILHECAKNEIYNSSVEDCAPIPGGGNLAWVSQDEECFTNGFPDKYFDSTMKRYYQLCMNGASVVAVCDDGWLFDANIQSCKPEGEVRTVFSEIQECKEYTSYLVCTKEGFFPVVYSDNTEGELIVVSGEEFYSYSDVDVPDNCRNCYYECYRIDDLTYELSVLCINDSTFNEDDDDDDDDDTSIIGVLEKNGNEEDDQSIDENDKNAEIEDVDYDTIKSTSTEPSGSGTTTLGYNEPIVNDPPSFVDITDLFDYIIKDAGEDFGSSTEPHTTTASPEIEIMPLLIDDVKIDDTALLFEPVPTNEDTGDIDISVTPKEYDLANCSRKLLEGTNCPEEGFFRYKNSCTLHYECYYSEECDKLLQSDLYVCPQCLKFNPKKGRCDFPEEVNECTYDTKKKRYCTAPGTYPVPNSCKKYYSCVEGKTIAIKNCPKGKIYDQQKSKCVKGGKCSTTTKCNKDEWVLDKFDCSRYYRCKKNGKKVQYDKRRCPEDEIFNGVFCENKSTSFLSDWNKINRMHYYQ